MLKINNVGLTMTFELYFALSWTESRFHINKASPKWELLSLKLGEFEVEGRARLGEIGGEVGETLYGRVIIRKEKKPIVPQNEPVIFGIKIRRF